MKPTNEFWRKCSSCKKSIGYRSKYFLCSVSTCTRKRTGYVFCSVPCFERHLPGARHRDAAAIEATSPTYEEWCREVENDEPQDTAAENSASQTPNSTTANEPARRILAATPGGPSKSHQQIPREILIVVSKLKDYIRLRSEMNTSQEVMSVLSDKLRDLCDRAIENARNDGRKTVMERDFKMLNFK